MVVKVVVNAVAALALGAGLVAFACTGGVGVEAPGVVGARDDTGCPSADEALAHTRAGLGIGAPPGGAVAELRLVLHEVLAQRGGVRVLVQAAAAILTDADAATVERLVAGITPGAGLEKLTPHLVEVLRYLAGTSAFVSGEHAEPVTAVHEMLTTCDSADTVATLRRLLELEIVDGATGPALATSGDGTRAWLDVVRERLGEAAADPELRAALGRIELDDTAPDTADNVRLGRQAFQLLARLVAANVAAPDFDPSATRQLVDDVLTAEVDDAAARARLAALLDVVLLVTAPDADVFPQVQSLMQCVSAADADAAIPGMLFDWLTIEELSVDTFLADVDTATSSAAAAELRRGLITVLLALEQRPNVARDVGRVLAELVAGDNALVMVRALLELQGQGVVAEVAALASGFVGCREP